MSSSRRIASVLAIAAVTVALVPASAQAAAPAPAPRIAKLTVSSMAASPIVTFATKADLAVDSSATAQPGEGVIRITTRVCGNANNWQNVATANDIAAPVYLVQLGQKLTVACTGGTQAPAAAPVAPAPAQAPAAASSGWAAPVNACVVSPYGPRWGTVHQGVDLGAGSGTPIRAAAAGTVSTGWQAGGAGNYTMINHGNGLYTVYMHQSSFAVQSGWVDAGQTIGYVGSTGDSQGPHLHFEVHPSGLWNQRVDPVSFMSARGIRLGC